MRDSEQRTGHAFLLALGLYFLAQVAIRLYHGGALELDEAEQVFDTQQLRLGYGTQPPLYAWLQWLVFQVSGVNHVGLSVLKHTLLFTLYLSVYRAASRMLDTRAAIAASACMVLLVPIGWEAAIDLTHSLLATVLAAGALWTYFALLCKPDRLRRALLGLLLGLGMQAKYNFAIFALGLAAGSLFVREHRKVIWTREMWITVCVAVLCLLPHAAWFIRQVDTATGATLHKMMARDVGAGYGSNVANGFKHLFLSIASFVTPLWLVLAFAYRSAGQGTLQSTAPPARFFLWLYGTGLACIVVLVLSGHLAFIKSRWLQPWLFSIPFACLLWFPPKRPVVCRRLLVTAAVTAMAMLAGLSLRPQIQAALGKDSRIHKPFPELASELVHRFPAVVAVAVQERYVGGNLRFQLPHLRVLQVDELCRRAPLQGGVALVLLQPGSAGLGDCPCLVAVERGQIGVRSPRWQQESLLFDYTLVQPNPRAGAAAVCRTP